MSSSSDNAATGAGSSATGDTRYRDLLRLFEQAPGFVTFFRGPQHVYELQNAAHARLTEYRDIIGKPVREALPDLAGQGFFELLDQVYATGMPYVGRAMPITIKPEGDAPAEEHFLDLVYQPIVDDHGHVIGIISQGNDVTEQVLAQAEVRRKQAELEALIKERTRTLTETQSALTLARQLQADKNNLLQLFGQAPGFIAVVRGPDHVARFLLGLPHLLPEAQVGPTVTADGLAFLVTVDGRADSVMTLEVSGGRVTGVYIVRNPHKLTLWR